MYVNTSGLVIYVRRCLRGVLFLNHKFNLYLFLLVLLKKNNRRYRGRVPSPFSQSTLIHPLFSWHMYEMSSLCSLECGANELVNILCRMGFSDVILSNTGSQFVSRTMRDFTDMLSIAESFIAINHAASNGITEGFTVVWNTSYLRWPQNFQVIGTNIYQPWLLHSTKLLIMSFLSWTYIRFTS